MLENCLRPKIDEDGEEHNLEDFWFQQDGATAHTARRPCAILKEVFPWSSGILTRGSSVATALT
jgi:hypothetical protein